MAGCNTVTVDQGKKLVKSVWNGKADYTGIEEGCNLTDGTVAKFKKGESLLLVDIRDMDMRFLPPGADKLLEQRAAFCVSHCRKLAYVVSSIMLEKQLEKTASHASMSNLRMFDSEQEAMKWLLE